MKRLDLARRSYKIVAAVALSLLGLALLPLLALPYDRLDWTAYAPLYGGDPYTRPRPPARPRVRPAPTPTPTPLPIQCAELPEPGDPLAATVNGQAIGLATYERELGQFLAAVEQSGVDLAGEEAQAQMPAWRAQVLDLLIDDVLVQQAAVEAEIAIPDEQVTALVTQEISRSGGPLWFETWLSQTGQTPAEFERSVCQDLLDQAVRDWVTAGVTATVDSAWASQIVVATEADAQLALGRLEAGRPFVVVAQEMSLDWSTARRGGSLGWFERGASGLPPEVEAAVFGAAPGQVQGPFRAGDRYLVVKTMAVQPAVAAESGEDAPFEHWLAGRRAAAQIELFVDLAP